LIQGLARLAAAGAAAHPHSVVQARRAKDRRLLLGELLSRVLSLDVGRRSIPVTGGFPYRPTGTPLRLIARGGTVVVQATRGIAVFDDRGRPRLSFSRMDAKLQEDHQLAPDGEQLAVGNSERLVVWDVRTGRARRVFPP
jgi:hypothetical protein